MSFRCDYCNKVQPDHTKPNKVVVETRDVEYTFKDRPPTKGWEIVEEANLCKECS